MKKLVSLVALLVVGFVASAQNVFNGTVVDKDGNPISSVKVEVVDSEKSSLTNLDGTFSIEAPANAEMLKFSYLGMNAKTIKGKSDMVVTLRNANRWSGVYDNYQYLVAVQGVIPSNFQYDSPAMGFTFGKVKELGWYAKALWTMNNVKANYMSATVGGMMRMGCPIYLYLGGGVASRVVAGKLTDGNYYKDTKSPINSVGFVADAGLMLRLNDFFVNAGVLVNFSDHFEGNISPASFNVGVGCCF